MTPSQARAALQCYESLLPGRVPADVAWGVPELWPHQVRGFREGDMVLALLRRQPRGEQEVILDEGRVRRLQLLVSDNPHPPGTRLARHWRHYRDGLPVRSYLELGGSPDVLVGDVRRGFVRVV